MEKENKSTVEQDSTPQQEEQEAKKNNTTQSAKKRTGKTAQIVTAEAVQAEEVPTIPIGSLQTIEALQPEIAVHSVASLNSVNMAVPLVVQPAEYRRSLNEWIQIWIDGARFKYIPLSLMPVILGSVLAWTNTITSAHLVGIFDISLFIGSIIAVILLQIGANLINDYYDYLKGVDTSNTFGPGGLIEQGHIKPTNVLKTGLVFLGIGAIIGLVVSLEGGPFVCLFGLIALLCAYFYSATKYSLSNLGLTELVSFLIFGPCLTLGAYMIQTKGSVSNDVFLYSLPLGLLAAAIVHTNNMRDLEGDVHAGRHTLASILGLTWSRVIYIALVILAYAVIAVRGIPHGAPHLILITFWTLPVAVVNITGAIRTQIAAGFQQIMLQTRSILIAFSILLIVALLFSALLPALSPMLPNPALPEISLPF
ncbi:MAG TPA: prenyltransferase [Dictyobacter sp.]|jgi:1,4-dihydroxy-2-naphthoate octaprenyltransferase|nr:prenyltransferase [Dictyobacter sp.]